MRSRRFRSAWWPARHRIRPAGSEGSADRPARPSSVSALAVVAAGSSRRIEPSAWPSSMTCGESPGDPGQQLAVGRRHLRVVAGHLVERDEHGLMPPVAGDDAGHRRRGRRRDRAARPRSTSVRRCRRDRRTPGRPTAAAGRPCLRSRCRSSPATSRPRCQPVDAEFGEARAVAHQALGGIEQAALDLLASLLPPGLRLAGD